MSDSFYLTEDGRLMHEDSSGHVLWSSDQAPVVQLPDEYAITANVTLHWPDFDKNNAYGYDSGNSPFTGGFEICASFTTVLPGEWGPGQSGSHYLAPQVLGTVPSHVNMVRVVANLTQIKVPSDWLTIPISSTIQNGKQFQVTGGSVVVERFPQLWTRGFEITRSGTSILLNRYQSVRNTGDYPFWVPYGSGWTHGGRKDGHVAHLIETKSGGYVGGDRIKRRGDRDQCSLTDVSDYSSTYAGTIKIVPCVAR